MVIAIGYLVDHRPVRRHLDLDRSADCGGSLHDFTPAAFGAVDRRADVDEARRHYTTFW